MNNLSRPLITTIIPTYRRPKMLRRAIQSVLDQTYPYFQICVYDNASGDETAEVVAEFARKDPRVKYYCHSENIGGVKNFIFGMEHVNTSFFSFLADDDLLLPSFYQATMEGFNKHPEAMFSVTGSVSVDEKIRIGLTLKRLQNWQDGIYYSPEGFIKEIKTLSFSVVSALYRAEVIKEMGLINENLPYIPDEYIFRLATKLPYVVCTKPCYITWLHELSTSGAGLFKAHDVFLDLQVFIDEVRQWVLPMEISEEVKQEIIVQVSQMPENVLYFILRKSILNKNFKNATEAISILREKLNAKRIFILESVLWIFKTFPWALNFIHPLVEIRRYIKSYRTRRILLYMGCLENILKTINKYQ